MTKLKIISYINRIIKTSYHLFAAYIILYIMQNQTNNYIYYSLLFIGLFHLYDVWWFLNNEGNAPI
jgi:hypothetical protein